MKNIRKLVLDTTFILPLFGIDIELTSKFEQQIQKIWHNRLNGFQIFLPSVCLIESMDKLLSLYRKNQDHAILDRYQMILPTVLNLPIEIFNCELNPKASMLASIIRHSGHTDFMDCWIAGTAVALDAILLTQDTELAPYLKMIPETKDLVIWSWRDIEKILGGK